MHFDSESGYSDLPPLSPLKYSPAKQAAQEPQQFSAASFLNVRRSLIDNTAHDDTRLLLKLNSSQNTFSEAVDQAILPRTVSDLSFASVSNLDFMTHSHTTRHIDVDDFTDDDRNNLHLAGLNIPHAPMQNVEGSQIHEIDDKHRHSFNEMETGSNGICVVPATPELLPSCGQQDNLEPSTIGLNNTMSIATESYISHYAELDDESKYDSERIVLVDDSDCDSTDRQDIFQNQQPGRFSNESTEQLIRDEIEASEFDSKIKVEVANDVVHSPPSSPSPTSLSSLFSGMPRSVTLGKRIAVKALSVNDNLCSYYFVAESPEVPQTWKHPQSKDCRENIRHLQSVANKSNLKSSSSAIMLDYFIDEQLKSNESTTDRQERDTQQNTPIYSGLSTTDKKPKNTISSLLLNAKFAASTRKLIDKLYSPETFLPLGTKLPPPNDPLMKQYLACQPMIQSNKALPILEDGASDQGESWINLNVHITNQLEELENTYKTLGDAWRTYTYRRVASVFKQLRFKVETESQVRDIANQVRGVGPKTVNKVIEILRNSNPNEASTDTTSNNSYILKRLQILRSRTDIRAMNELMKVHGIGAKKARDWYEQHGVQTVDDLRYLCDDAGGESTTDSDDCDDDEDGSEEMGHKFNNPRNLDERAKLHTQMQLIDETDSASTCCEAKHSLRSNSWRLNTASISPSLLSSHNPGSILSTKISKAQKVGIEFSGDSQKRVPRAEISAIATYVERVLKRLAPNAVIVCCGSYRRGAASSGDVDLLISDTSWVCAESSAQLRNELCCSLLTALQVLNVQHEYLSADINRNLNVDETLSEKEASLISSLARQFIASPKKPEDMVLPPGAKPFLTGSLSSTGTINQTKRACVTSSGKAFEPIKRVLRIDADGSVGEHAFQCTWSGFCKLPSWNLQASGVNRRLDIKFYAFPHLPYATLYFTGSDHFNRSMRYYAKRLGWSLADSGLRPCVRSPQGVRLSLGKSIFALSEEDIFDAMGLEYVPPALRNTFQSVQPIGMNGKNDQNNAERSSQNLEHAQRDDVTQ